MCQVVPFTLPCCRKVYVEVSKLPSCPNSWPNRKCPPELCIQVRGYEAEDREAGICWRCKARTTGASTADRESLRPRIDKATLVLGLDELGVTGRRRREENNGNCWFCGATGGCNTCGAKDINAEDGEGRVEGTGKRKRDHGTIKGKEVIKKVKAEKKDQAVPAKAFEYLTPNTALHSQHPYPEVHSHMPQAFGSTSHTNTQNYDSNDFPHSRVPQPDIPNHFKAGPTQYYPQASWQPAYRSRQDSSEPSNAYVGQQSHFVNDGGQGNSATQYFSNEHLTQADRSSHPNLYRDDGHSGANASELWFDRVHQEDKDQAEFKPQHHSNEHLPHLDPNIHPDLQQPACPGISNNYPNEHQSGPHVVDCDQQDFKHQQHDRNECASYTYPNMSSEDPETHNQGTYAQAYSHSNDNDDRYRTSQVVGNESQLGLKPEEVSLASVEYTHTDMNIQPGLDDLPLQFNVTELDDDILARLLKKYGGGENPSVDVTSDQGAINEHGSSSVSEQKHL
ncbi:hypothetical protein BKA65DRAFT_7757 [Rhexocercosporidium sp. MPI-PUGE-AT-0058]|nr:hypothetical protein BKA65DRAFT_7757 [Rhexocercosporidium sp. MPI-PUGE-AT-0058]